MIELPPLFAGVEKVTSTDFFVTLLAVGAIDLNGTVTTAFTTGFPGFKHPVAQVAQPSDEPLSASKVTAPM